MIKRIFTTNHIIYIIMTDQCFHMFSQLTCPLRICLEPPNVCTVYSESMVQANNWKQGLMYIFVNQSILNEIRIKHYIQVGIEKLLLQEKDFNLMLIKS